MNKKLGYPISDNVIKDASMKSKDTMGFIQLVKLILLAGVVVLGIVHFSDVLSFFQKVSRLLTPLVIGFSIAFLVDLIVKPLERIVMKMIKREKLSRALAIVLAFFIVVAIILGVLLILIPQLVIAIEQFIIKLPVVFTDFEEAIDSFILTKPEWDQAFSQVIQYFERLRDSLLASLPDITDVAFGFLGSALTSIINILLGSIFSVYLLVGKQGLLRQLNRLLAVYVKPSFAKKTISVCRVANQTFMKFFAGQLIEALILGGLCTLGMMIFRFPYAVTIGTVVGMTALIPMIGAYIGGAIGFVLIFPDNFKLAVLFILFLVILQQLEGNIIYPRVVGNSVGLPGIWVFCSIIIGGGLWGILGILLGVPVAASLYHLLKKDIQRKVSDEMLTAGSIKEEPKA